AIMTAQQYSNNPDSVSLTDVEMALNLLYNSSYANRSIIKQRLLEDAIEKRVNSDIFKMVYDFGVTSSETESYSDINELNDYDLILTQLAKFQNNGENPLFFFDTLSDKKVMLQLQIFRTSFKGKLN